jgi:hypothetical protein
VTLFWNRYGDWEPEGGQRKPWSELERGDLIQSDRKLWSVVEVRPVPVIDWDERDRESYERWTRQRRNSQFVPLVSAMPASEEDWAYRPLYLIAIPAGGGKRHHTKICPYGSIRQGAWVISPHHPVCKDCGELWPCREVEITQQVDREAAKLAKLEQILPGCCWACGEPVTHRQSVIRFDGDNLLLPGADPAVFHLRRKGTCLSGALAYEKRWVAAGEGRRWQLQCPGKLIRHVDGNECSEDPFCPGGKARHQAFMNHTFGRLSVYGSDFICLRCKDAIALEGLTLSEPPPGALM